MRSGRDALIPSEGVLSLETAAGVSEGGLRLRFDDADPSTPCLPRTREIRQDAAKEGARSPALREWLVLWDRDAGCYPVQVTSPSLYEVWEGAELKRLSPTRFVLPARAGVCEDFVERAIGLEEQGYADAALDLIYDSIDELLYAAQFALCASILNDVDVARCSDDVLLGLLTATLPAKSRIPTRGSFLRRVEAQLRVRGEYEDGILEGLA